MKSSSEKAVHRILFYRNLPTEFQFEINYYIFSHHLTYYALLCSSKIQSGILFVEMKYSTGSCNYLNPRLFCIEKFLKLYIIRNVALINLEGQAKEMLDYCRLVEKSIISFRSKFTQNISKRLVQSVDKSIKNLSKVNINLPVEINTVKIDMMFNVEDAASYIKNRKGI